MLAFFCVIMSCNVSCLVGRGETLLWWTAVICPVVNNVKVCTALNRKNQHHYGKFCAVRKAMKQQDSEDTKTNANPSGRRGSMYVLENDDHQEDSAEALAMRGGPPQGRARDFSAKKPTPPEESDCWNCKGKGHRYTDCPHQITNENCLRRLKTVQYEYERRKRFLEHAESIGTSRSQRAASARQIYSQEHIP